MRESAIDDVDTHLSLSTELKERGPDLGLHDEELLRLYASKKTSNSVSKIEWEEEMLYLGNLSLGTLKTADGGCGEQDGLLGMGRIECFY